MQEFTGGRFILGPRHRASRRSNTLLGIEMGEPMAKMREVVTALRKAIDGGRTRPQGHVEAAASTSRACRVRWCKLAGEIADGVIFNFFPPARVKQAFGELAEGAKIGNRNINEIEPTLFATAFISDDLEAARRPARKLLSRYGGLRFYGNMLANAGFRNEIEGIRAAGRDEPKAMAAVTDNMIDSALLVGPESRIRERLAELAAPGLGTVIVFVNPVNEDRVSGNKRAIRALKA